MGKLLDIVVECATDGNDSLSFEFEDNCVRVVATTDGEEPQHFILSKVACETIMFWLSEANNLLED